MSLNRVICLGIVLLGLTVPKSAQSAVADRNAIALEALSRLDAAAAEADPVLKEALLKVLEANRGRAEFVQLVKQFRLTGQERGLVLVASNLPRDAAGVEAARLVLIGKELELLTSVLSGGNAVQAAGLAEALGNTADKRAVPLLLPLVSDSQRDANVRKQAVRSLARTHEGASELVALAKKDALPAEVRFVATTELNTARWPDIKQQAATLLPLPQGRNAQPLPPLAELLSVRGDAARGAQVYFREEVQCAKCHRVGDKGLDFGPALTEIGTKLGKDALYEAILDPSAGVSFDYEGWEITTKDGNELTGIMVSESDGELTLKNQQGVPVRLRKADLARRQKLKLSLMPSGLQLTMTTQELVDLVEYLSTLRQK